MAVIRRRYAAAVALALVAACGGRSALETDDALGSGAESPSPGAAHAGTGSVEPSPSQPAPGVPDPSTATAGGATPPGASAGAGGSGPTSGNPKPGASPPDPGPVSEPKPDANCTSDHAKGGMACSMPCLTTCGFYDLGMKACDCVNGVFVSCHCPRPWDYQGSPTAPTCNTSDGRTHWLDNTPCTSEWAQCIGTDPVSGTNPRGCVCSSDPVNGKLEWTCGSTNKWFLHE